jgi:hypothetical protein
MPLLKGYILIAALSLVCGVFTGINAVLLKVAMGIEMGLASFITAMIVAIIETLLFVQMVDSVLIRRRAKSRNSQAQGNPDRQPIRGTRDYRNQDLP